MLKKLKDKLNKPYAATWEEWDIWNKNSKEKYPFEYFLLETIPDKWNNFTKFFTHPINDFRFYVRSRFFDKYHLVNTGLKPGGYYEVDTRLIHSAFNLLVDYIEVECAHMNSLSNKEKKKSKPWAKRWRGSVWSASPSSNNSSWSFKHSGWPWMRPCPRSISATKKPTMKCGKNLIPI